MPAKSRCLNAAFSCCGVVTTANHLRGSCSYEVAGPGDTLYRGHKHVSSHPPLPPKTEGVGGHLSHAGKASPSDLASAVSKLARSRSRNRPGFADKACNTWTLTSSSLSAQDTDLNIGRICQSK